jgi:hypothetical protein
MGIRVKQYLEGCRKNDVPVATDELEHLAALDERDAVLQHLRRVDAEQEAARLRLRPGRDYGIMTGPVIG